MPPYSAQESGIYHRSPLDTAPVEPLGRVPLQPLEVSSGGTISRFGQERTFRPLPSIDKENMRALIRALNHRHVTLTQNFRDIDHLLSLAQRQTQVNQPGEQPPQGNVGLDQEQPPANTVPAARVPDPDHPRLSMPLPDSDGSSEPDLSVLGMARPGVVPPQNLHDLSYDDVDDEILSQENYDDGEETSVEEEHEVEDEHEAVLLIDPATAGLKEISNLARFTVSSHKPGNGVEELRNDDLRRYWQSDGPQPHKLTIYFVKRVGIRDIRFYVDYGEDESYTPTKIIFKSGTSENNLIEFASMTLDSPIGWQAVPIAGAGGDPDGNTLVSYVLQMQILENHQNGKDTHLRGIKIYAFDSESAQGAGRENNPIDEAVRDIEDPVPVRGPRSRAVRYEPGDGGLTIPDFMRDPELR